MNPTLILSRIHKELARLEWSDYRATKLIAKHGICCESNADRFLKCKTDTTCATAEAILLLLTKQSS